jgi:hypothetical protein
MLLDAPHTLRSIASLQKGKLSLLSRKQWHYSIAMGWMVQVMVVLYCDYYEPQKTVVFVICTHT